MSHYETLGVHKGATPDEIKRAYRKLASQHHPDKGGDTAKFQEIEAAYRVLSDPAQRQQYDNPHPEGYHFNFNGGNVPPEMQDIFNTFGFNFGGGPFKQQRRNRDLRVDIAVDLASTLTEQVKTISVQTTNGQRENVEVRIPRGINTGNTIKYAGLGDNLFNTIARGDLYVQINVQNNNNFMVNNIDLYTRVSVNCFIAIVGGDVEVKTLDGRTLSLTIPPGTQPGVKFRISGEGLYQLNSPNRGHLYVELTVTIPQDLTSEQLDIVRSLTNYK
jgi:DnaJ-class molecular chaperone